VCQKQEEPRFFRSGRPHQLGLQTNRKNPQDASQIFYALAEDFDRQATGQCMLGQWTRHVGKIEVAGNTRVLEGDRRMESQASVELLPG
jgi:hypothetical protein